VVLISVEWAEKFRKKDPCKLHGVPLIYSFYPTPKMTAHSGVFTIHAFPWTDLRTPKANEYKLSHCDIECGGRYVVPACDKPQILASLERLGVNSRTLMVDLAGIAEGLWRCELPRDNQDERKRRGLV